MQERPEYDLAATGKNLRRIRTERMLSVDDVRRYMKLSSVQAIYKWERGGCFPSADNLLALAEFYEVNPAEILVRKDTVKDINKELLDGYITYQNMQ